jgi:hypothetical protein
MRLASLAFVLAVAPLAVQAQSRTASDISGGTVTSAAVLGGSYVPGFGLRPVPVGANQFDPNALERIRAASTALENQVNRGELVGPGGEPIEPAAQLAVLGVLKSATTGAGLSVQAVRDIFGAGVPNDPVLAAQLLAALVDMGPTPSPVMVAAASRALNAYVAAADPAFLASPPGEFAAAFAIINRYVAAATQTNPSLKPGSTRQ